MEDLTKTLSTKFGAAFKASRFNSLADLSVSSGCSSTAASKVALGRTGKKGPSVFGLWRMAEQMGVTLNDLLPPIAKSKRPGAHYFLSLYEGDDTHISAFDDVIDYCDIYLQPHAGRSRIEAVGPKSVLGEKTQIFDPKLQQDQYDMWSLEKRSKASVWQTRAWENGVAADYEYFSGSYIASQRNIEGAILKVGCKVLGRDHKPRLLVYIDQVR